jgi:hypothetical protein
MKMIVETEKQACMKNYRLQEQAVAAENEKNEERSILSKWPRLNVNESEEKFFFYAINMRKEINTFTFSFSLVCFSISPNDERF